ncbi:MAG: hypothetical protein LBI73_00205, partial [Myroides sp.]|nr:hypothetical protein [Myroides sp.]
VIHRIRDLTIAQVVHRILVVAIHLTQDRIIVQEALHTQVALTVATVDHQVVAVTLAVLADTVEEEAHPHRLHHQDQVTVDKYQKRSAVHFAFFLCLFISKL